MLKFDPFQPYEVNQAIVEVLKSGCFVKGPKVKEFEEKWAKRCGMKYAVGISSGAMALELVLQGNDINTYNKETFKAVPNAIRRMGKYAWAVKRPELYAHHLHDHKLDYIPKIEDCSHCHGYQPVSQTAIFSFFPTKILGACGEAGIIVTNNKTAYERYLKLRSHNDTQATNARMDEIQAAVLLAKLPFLDKWIQRRHQIVAMYDKELNKKTEGRYHYAYCIKGSEKKRRQLLKFGIESAFYYTSTYMSLPLHPYLTDKEVNYVIRCALKL